MSKLNPDGDWVPYKVDDIDHEDDDSFWDGTKKVKRKYKKGSDRYGHIVVSKNRYDRRPGERRERLITTRGGRRARPVIGKGAKGARTRTHRSIDVDREDDGFGDGDGDDDDFDTNDRKYIKKSKKVNRRRSLDDDDDEDGDDVEDR